MNPLFLLFDYLRFRVLKVQPSKNRFASYFFQWRFSLFLFIYAQTKKCEPINAGHLKMNSY